MWNSFPGEYVEALLTDTLVRSRRLYKTPFFSTPIQTLYFYIPVSGQPQLWTPFSRPVSAYKSFHRTRSLYWPIRGGPVQFCERVEISLVIRKGREICHFGQRKGSKGITDAFYGCQNVENRKRSGSGSCSVFGFIYLYLYIFKRHCIYNS